MMADATAAIRNANERVIGGDLGAARDILVAAWRERQLTEIADAITEIESFLPASAAKDPVAVAVTAWSEVARLEEANVRRRERLESLVRLPKDPRIAQVLMTTVVGHSFRSPLNRPIWQQLFVRLGEIGDVRILPALRKLEREVHASPRHWYCESRDEITAACALLETEQTLPTPDEAATLARLGEVLGRERAAVETAQKLLDAVYADPDSDAPRAAYATFLLERRDPRGELITLQLDATRRALTATEQERVEFLVRQYGRAWLGPIAPWIVDAVRYERGFPFACTFTTPEGLDTDEMWAGRASGAWSTIREAYGPPPGNINRLRRLAYARVEEVAFWARKNTLALEDLEVRVAGHGGIEATVVELAALLDEVELPSLRRLGVTQLLGNDRNSPAQFRPLFATRIAPQLTTFFATSGASSIAAWIADPPPVIPTLEIDSEIYNPGWSLKLSRDRDGRFSLLHVSSPRRVRKTSPVDWLFDALDAIPPRSLTELTVSWEGLRPSKAVVKRLDAVRATLLFAR